MANNNPSSVAAAPGRLAKITMEISTESKPENITKPKYGVARNFHDANSLAIPINSNRIEIIVVKETKAASG